MTDVFISYSRKDISVVDKICSQFDGQGISYWIDRKGIAGGEQWRKEIVEGITNSTFFVIVISANSTRSINVLKELNIAESKKRKILPIIIDQAAIPPEMEYQLAGVQHIDFNRGFAEAMLRLIEAIKGPKKKVTQHSPTPVKVPAVQTTAQGSIKLLRKNPPTYDAGTSGNYGVWIDNQKAGTIGYGDQKNFVRDAGSHTIYVEWMGIKSNALQFILTDSQEVHLVCGEEQGLLLGKLFIRPM